MSDSETMRKGAEMRRKLLGDQWVERSSKNAYADPVMKEFIDVATESVFGTLWTRPGSTSRAHADLASPTLPPRTRPSWRFTCAWLCARAGREELTEALIHLLGYCGAPATRDALLVASRVFKDVRAGN